LQFCVTHSNKTPFIVPVLSYTLGLFYYHRRKPGITGVGEMLCLAMQAPAPLLPKHSSFTLCLIVQVFIVL
jgi:hypothetical protein